MSFTPWNTITKKGPFTVVRASATSRWNDVIDSNTTYLTSSGDTLQTSGSYEFPMFAEVHLSYDNCNVTASWIINTPATDRYRRAFLNDYQTGAGARAVSDDKSFDTNRTTFTRTTYNSTPTAIPATALNPPSCATIIYFGE